MIPPCSRAGIRPYGFDPPAGAACIRNFPSENLRKCLVCDQPASCQVIAGEFCVSDVGLPLLSRAGVNLARRRMMLHVAESSALLPVDRTIEQFVTRPSGPMVSDATAVPSAPAALADSG